MSPHLLWLFHVPTLFRFETPEMFYGQKNYSNDMVVYR